MDDLCLGKVRTYRLINTMQGTKNEGLLNWECKIVLWNVVEQYGAILGCGCVFKTWA